MVLKLVTFLCFYSMCSQIMVLNVLKIDTPVYFQYMRVSLDGPYFLYTIIMHQNARHFIESDSGCGISSVETLLVKVCDVCSVTDNLWATMLTHARQ